jgi:hypothetical protein
MQHLAAVLIATLMVAGCGFDARIAVQGPQSAQDALLASDVPGNPGYPGEALPEGHPPLYRSGPALPPGHPAILPPGHPPIPAGDCPAGGMRGFGSVPADAAAEPEIVST